ncbi:MAG: glycoside hydrolase family 2 protein [Actinomycetota bacterium]|nr:glycoside hydrolase family 2 protein [Actinomycetota bacterium]
MPVPGTVAAALRDAGQWAPGDTRDLDADDWWFRCRFPGPSPAGEWELHLDGLATLGDVWLNGHHLLSTANMFRAHRVDVTPSLCGDNELVVRCAALTPELAVRRGRPAWKTRLVANQNLRWFRTSLLGRTPSWTLTAAPVGLWRDVTLRRRTAIEMVERHLRVDHDGRDGIVDIRVVLDVERSDETDVFLTVADTRMQLTTQTHGHLITASGQLRVPGAQAWWPATHGAQPLYPASLEITGAHAAATIGLSRIGFRALSFGPTEAPSLTVNREPIFCRGACWTPVDPIGLAPRREELRAALEQVRDAGMNVVRVQGSMVYESPMFLELCDELGLLLWQDLMFATLDYPIQDPAFVEEVTAEVVDVLAGLQGHPCLLAVCGGSETAQQAAMTGRPAGRSPDPLFDKLLGDLVGEHLPTVAYFANSPSGGDVPFSVDTGIAHYFGVGAYRRPLTDARMSGVRFATECLAFSVLPGDDTVQGWEADGVVVGDHRWKGLVPSDAGRSWDFEDVRDHYVRQQFAVDPIAIRDVEPDHYVDLGRAAVATVMAKTFSEWRRPGSSCKGAIVLQQRDVRDNAGMGLVDRHGRPKAAWYALRRVLRPAAILLSDEGLNGLDIYALNDGPEAIHGTLQVEAFSGTNCVASAELPCAIGPRSSAMFRAESVLGGFLDITYAYRFGPRSIDAVAARWSCDGELVSRAVFLPDGVALRRDDLGLRGVARRTGDDTYALDISTTRTARCILIHAPGAVLSDDAFDLEPGGRATVTARGNRPVRFELRAVNSLGAVSLVTEDA